MSQAGYEHLLQQKIIPDLEKGRPNWDGPHTLAVVDFMKQIIENSPELKLDKDVLVIAAYAHDWGYGKTDIDRWSLNLDEIHKVKTAHMKIGATQLAELLRDPVFSFLTDVQKKRAVHLVAIHDQLDNIHDVDEHIIVEADTLGALDVTKVKPTFDEANSERYLKSTNERRLPLFITKFGKQKYQQLFIKHQQYYQKKF